MAHPFDRADAKARAQMARDEAENWDSVASERARRASEYEGERRLSAEAHADVAHMKAAFARCCADAYERIARGKRPFPHGDVIVELPMLRMSPVSAKEPR